MKALAFDETELCAVCFLEVLKKHESVHLLLGFVRYREVSGDALCPGCSLPYGRPECEDAAEEMLDFIERIDAE